MKKNYAMATISMFYGMIVRMYCSPKEHNLPHIHVYYNSFVAVFDVKTGKMMEGKTPKNQKKLVQAWIILHKNELLADWRIAMDGNNPYQIEPLK